MNQKKPITSLSPFVIEKQIESTIGTLKSVRKLKNQTLLVETSRKTQTENLLKMKTFFNLPVTVSEHHTLNSSKGIIRDRALKGETEENIKEYLKDQGVIAVKRFTIKKGNSTRNKYSTSNFQQDNSAKIFKDILQIHTSRYLYTQSSAVF